VNLLGFWALGARNLLIPNPRPLTNLRRAFENYKITWMSGVNTLFNGLSNEIWFLDTPPKHLKFASAGGMALQAAVAERWEEITGKPLLQGYGLTETSPVLTFNPLGKTRGLHRRAGPLDRDRLSRRGGQSGAAGRAGEIAARGPQVMKGYWRRPDETAKTMRGDWFLTGDIGVMDPDGYIRIVDRKKDMVVVSGFNVYPNEIEDCLATHPGVLEAAVIGVPDASTGEAVKAFIVARDSGLTQADIRAHCKEHLTAYKVPRSWSSATTCRNRTWARSCGKTCARKSWRSRRRSSGDGRSLRTGASRADDLRHHARHGRVADTARLLAGAEAALRPDDRGRLAIRVHALIGFLMITLLPCPPPSRSAS
jgi:long-chain acyl-CoA synthetase